MSEIRRAVDAQTLEDALSRWVRSRLPAELEQLSLHDKTLKGSRDGEFPAQHVLSANAPQVQITRLKPHQADARRLFALVGDHWRHVPQKPSNYWGYHLFNNRTAVRISRF